MTITGISDNQGYCQPPSNLINQLMGDISFFFAHPNQATENRINALINLLKSDYPKLKNQLTNLQGEINQYYSFSIRYKDLEQQLEFATTPSQKNHIILEMTGLAASMPAVKNTIESLLNAIKKEV